MIVQQLVTLFTFQSNGAQLAAVQANIQKTAQQAAASSAAASTSIQRTQLQAVAAATAVGTFTGVIGAGIARMAFLALRNTAATIGGIVADTIDAGDKMEAALGRLRATENTPAAALEVYEKLYQVALQTGVAVDASVSSFQRFRIATQAIGATSGQVVELVAGLQKAFIAGGSTTQEARAVMTQMGQALGSDRFQGDEMRSFTENAPILAHQFARELGVSVAQMRKMGTEGKLTTAVVFPAMMRAIGKVNETFQNFPVTFERARRIAVVAFTRFAADFDRAFEISKTLSRITMQIAMAVDRARIWIVEIRKVIDAYGGLEQMYRLLAVAFALAFGGAAVAMFATMGSSIAGMVLALNLMLLKITAIAIGFGAWVLVLEDLYVWMQGGKSLTGDALGPFDAFMNKIRVAFGPMNEEFENLFAGQNPNIRKFVMLLRDVKEAIDFWVSSLTAFGMVVRGDFAGAVDQFKAGMDSITSSTSGWIAAIVGVIAVYKTLAFAIRSVMAARAILAGGAGAAGAAAAGGAATGAAAGAAGAAATGGAARTAMSAVGLIARRLLGGAIIGGLIPTPLGTGDTVPNYGAPAGTIPGLTPEEIARERRGDETDLERRSRETYEELNGPVPSQGGTGSNSITWEQMLQGLATPMQNPVSPDAVTSPPSVTNITQENRITNDITINAPGNTGADIAAGASQGVGAASEEFRSSMGELARQIGVAIPRSEAPAQ